MMEDRSRSVRLKLRPKRQQDTFGAQPKRTSSVSATMLAAIFGLTSAKEIQRNDLPAMHWHPGRTIFRPILTHDLLSNYKLLITLTESTPTIKNEQQLFDSGEFAVDFSISLDFCLIDKSLKVTGVSGFLGAQIVHQLLEAGYRVRGTVRSKKVAFVQEWYTQYGNKAEIVPLDDLVHGDYSAALKDVEAVIHNAAPLVGRSATHAEAIQAGVNGTRNILEQGEKAGVTKFSIVSSIATVWPPHRFGEKSILTDQDWNPVTLEQGLDPSADAGTVYAAEKTLAEQFAWKFADEHPSIDVTTVNPTFFLGPFAPEWRASEPGINALSTNMFIYDLLRRDGPLIWWPCVIDVRDVARGLVLSLAAPPSAKVGRKRILMSGEWLVPREVAAYVAEQRPELKDRLSEAWKNDTQNPTNIVDNSRAIEVLGLRFTDWRKTVLDAVDSVVATEKVWLAQGWEAHS
ncbi:hypothetical protein EIP86_004420 [Pleurotus ostreatoroseus]|nr:hypothetical protein EIP86_004420 [Pleurotus ostreatoroseus]